MLTQSPLSDISSLQRKVGIAAVHQGTAIVFADGHARGNPGPAGAGAVVAMAGDIIESVGRFCGITTNTAAQYTGLIMGLEKALELGFRQVEVRMDSELIVLQMHGSQCVDHSVDGKLNALYRDSMALSRRFTEFKIVYVRSEFNRDADRLANEAMNKGFSGALPHS